MKNLLVLITAVLLIGCQTESSNHGSAGSSTGDDFEGYFSYLADANIFQSCDGSVRLSIAEQAEYLNLEKAYLALGLSGKRVYVRLKGSVENVAAAEGEGMERAILVTEVVEIDPAKRCSEKEDSGSDIYGEEQLAKIKSAMTIRGTEPDGEIITGDDLIGVNFVEEEIFELIFKPEGVAKMQRLTKANMDKNMEIRLGEEVISKPLVKAVIGLDRMQVTGMKKEFLDKILTEK